MRVAARTGGTTEGIADYRIITADSPKNFFRSKATFPRFGWARIRDEGGSEGDEGADVITTWAGISITD